MLKKIILDVECSNLQISRPPHDKSEPSSSQLESSPGKSSNKKMKYKYDKYLNMYLESSVDSNVKEIQDMEIGHVNRQDFIDQVDKAPSLLTNLIRFELHKYASFPVAAHYPDFVLVVADHFDLNTRQVKDVDQNVVMTLENIFFNNVSRAPQSRKWPIFLKKVLKSIMRKMR